MKHPELTDDERVNIAASQLFHRVSVLAGRHGVMSQKCREDVLALIREHRRDCKFRSIPFPEVVPLFLVHAGGIKIVRRDSDRSALQTHILNITVEYPKATPQEIAQAIIWAFPEHRPSQFDLRPGGRVIESSGAREH